ncbi:MAG: hypothetical protein P8185_04325 [Deltaproteobacteria bacterium]
MSMLFYRKEVSKCRGKKVPGQGDRGQARVKAHRAEAAAVGVGAAVMERVRAATVCVQIAVKKLHTSRELPVLI